MATAGACPTIATGDVPSGAIMAVGALAGQGADVPAALGLVSFESFPSSQGFAAEAVGLIGGSRHVAFRRGS